MASLVDHARRELKLQGEDPKFAAALVKAVQAFTSYGHGGGSGECGIDTLTRLLKREALTPLTSDPKEWEDVSQYTDGAPWWQNKRDPRAMSHDGGQTWWYVSGRYPGERTRDGGEEGVIVRCDGCGWRGCS